MIGLSGIVSSVNWRNLNNMNRCETCKNVFWKPTSTGLCKEAYCKITDKKTPINPWADHICFKCKNYSSNR